MYQVALSIDRWLRLSDDDILELEAGEDIDLCVGALTFDDADQERVLEQIKHREGSITLRTDEARAFLANAYEHQNNNPGRRLVSRLVSTASAGQETPTPLSPRAPAIERWGAINAHADPVADRVAIEAIISLLLEAKQPRNFNELTWNLFASLVRTADASQFARFMAHVEWSLGADEHEDVESKIRARLVSDGWCSSAETASSAYQHLFFHVFHLLAKSEAKSLTRASLQSTLDRQERTESDLKIWERVSNLLAQHDLRISLLETEAIATRATIQSLARMQDVASELVIVNQRRNFSPPPSVVNYVDRAALNAQLASKFRPSGLVHVFGESGIGKTQLVRAAAASRSASWVRLRHRTGHDVLDAIRAGKEHAITNGHELLILDDIGRLADSDPIAELITELISEPFVAVSTSLFDVAPRLKSILGSACETMSVPTWGIAEARALLTPLEAPQRLLTDSAIEVFIAITRGHPALLRALATYLQQRAWVVNESTLQALFSSDYAKSERDEARRLVQETVPSSPDRELLYRLDLVLGSIRDAQIDAVSGVEPRIPLPREKLADMRGLWIQDDGSAGLVLSPLLIGIAVELLSPADVRAVRTALAEEIAHRKVISEADVDRVLAYFVAAGHWNRAALYYVIALNAYLEAPTNTPAPRFIDRWMRSLPSEIGEPLAAFVRASQIRFLDRTKGDATDHVSGVLALLERCAQQSASDGDSLACISAALIAGPLRSPTTGATSLRLTRLAVTFARRLLELHATDASETERYVLSTVWVSNSNVRTPADVREWAALLSFLSQDEIAKSRPNTDLARQGMRLMPQAAVRAESRRATPRWAALDAALQELEATAIAKSLDPLAVGAAAARILAAAEYQNQIDTAVTIAEQVLAKHLAPEDEFTIRSILGHQLIGAKRTREALDQLIRAVSVGGKEQPTDLMRAHGAISVLLRDSDRERSLEHARTAVDCARVATVPTSELIRALAELALTVSDPRSALPPWSEAVALTLDAPPESDEERGLYALLGHATGYFMGVTTTGRAPLDPPLPGVFLRDTARAAPYYKPGKRALMAAHLEAVANAVGDEGEAYRWAERTAELVETDADAETRALLVMSCMPFWIREDMLSVSIHQATKAFTVPESPDDKTAAADGERFSRFVALFPAVLRAATLRIQLAPTAAAAAQEIVNACRERERTAGNGLWDLAAQMVEAALLGDRSPLAELCAKAKASADGGLEVLGMLMGMYVPNTELAEVLASQLLALHAAATSGRETAAFSRHITFPFLHGFWTRALEREPHRFSLRFEKALNQSAQAGGSSGVRALLSSLLLEFPGLRFAADVKAWLASK